MQFRKYNVPAKYQGGGQSTSESQTPSYDGGGGGYVQPVDLTDVWNAINDNSTNISNNSTRINSLQNQLNNIEGKYLKHGGDSDDSDYGFGSLTSDLIKSTRLYDRSCGYEIYGDVDNGYTITVQDLDNTMIPFSGADGINYMVDYVGYATGTVEYPDAFHLANTTTGAVVKLQAGYHANPSQYFTLQEEHAYVRITDSTSGDDEMPPDMRPAPPGSQYQQISDTMYYHPSDQTTYIYNDADVAELAITDIEITATTAQAEIVNGAWMELEKDEQGNWIVPLDILGDDMTYSLRYKATIHYNRPNISGGFNVFIEGTDSTNNQTVMYGGSTKLVQATANAISVTSNNTGYGIMDDGFYRIISGNWMHIDMVKAPDVVWEAQAGSGLLGANVDISQSPTWQLTGLTLSGYKRLKFYIAPGKTGTTSSNTFTTPPLIVEMYLDSRMTCNDLYGHYTASALGQYPNDPNRLYACTVVVSASKDAVLFSRQSSLYGTGITSAADAPRYLYKIEGYTW